MLKECRNCKYWKATYDADFGTCSKKHNDCLGYDTCMSFHMSPEDEKELFNEMVKILKERLLRPYKLPEEARGRRSCYFKGCKFPSIENAEKAQTLLCELLKEIEQGVECVKNEIQE